MPRSGPQPLSLFSDSTISLPNLCIQVIPMSMILTLDLSLTMSFLHCLGFSCLLAFSLIFSSSKVTPLLPALGKMISYFKTLPCAPDSTLHQALSHLLLCCHTTLGVSIIILITWYYNCYFTYLSCKLNSKFLDKKSHDIYSCIPSAYSA